ncbi:MAG TPA: fructosamine kinase family protein [Bacteroidota bacterium]|nr:fructosamine kinase family protein [Bacteroidota bacterium]
MNTPILQIERALKNAVSSISPIGGGSISTVMRATLADGESVFVKTAPQSKDIFVKEGNGLRELAKSAAIKVPRVLFVDEEILILEYLPSQAPSNRKKFFQVFGEKFSRLHRTTSPTFGFSEDNYIGSTPQPNTPPAFSWREFYFTRRLEFQYRLAEKNGYADSTLAKLFGEVGRAIDRLIPEDGEPPALLHGDLWRGNFLCLENNAPALIDPAVYYGHREADLAMTILFGGFDDSFYAAYDEAYPLNPGWQRRGAVYKLYHLFNHLNLFGEGYYGQVVGTMKDLVR